jgi:hypothetical protein
LELEALVNAKNDLLNPEGDHSFPSYI